MAPCGGLDVVAEPTPSPGGINSIHLYSDHLPSTSPM